MYGIPGSSELGDWGFYRHDRCIIWKSGNAWTPESIPEDEVAPWHCPRYEAPCRKKHPCGSGWSGTGEVEKHGVALFWGSERGRDLDFEGPTPRGQPAVNVAFEIQTYLHTSALFARTWFCKLRDPPLPIYFGTIQLVLQYILEGTRKVRAIEWYTLLKTAMVYFVFALGADGS